MSEQKVMVVSIPPEVAAAHRTERAVDFAEIEAWLARFEDIESEDLTDMDREDLETDLEVATASYVPALLDEVRGAENALLRAGIADDGRPLAERIGDLVTARDTAIALFRNEDGTVGERAEDICRIADILRGKPITVEHRCADSAKCTLCGATRKQTRHWVIVGAATGEDIGCTSAEDPSPDDVGEPGATFREVDESACPLCSAPMPETDPGPQTADGADLLREIDRLRQQSDGADMRERAAVEAERAVVEFTEIDVLDRTPERLRIARRIRALPLNPAEAMTDTNFADALSATSIQDALNDALAKFAADPLVRARLNGSTARIAVLDESVPLERRAAAGMREYLNGAFDLTITIADLATALGISEADMAAIEAGTKSTDAAGWTTIQTACFCLGSGTKPEHIADPASSPAFQRAMEREEGRHCDTCGEPATKTGVTGTFCDRDADVCSLDIESDDAPEPVHYAAKGEPDRYPTTCGLVWTPSARFQWTDITDDVRGCPACENAAAHDTRA